MTNCDNSGGGGGGGGGSCGRGRGCVDKDVGHSVSDDYLDIRWKIDDRGLSIIMKNVICQKLNCLQIIHTYYILIILIILNGLINVNTVAAINSEYVVQEQFNIDINITNNGSASSDISNNRKLNTDQLEQFIDDELVEYVDDASIKDEISQLGVCQIYNGLTCETFLKNQSVFIPPDLTIDILEERLKAAYGVIKESKDMNPNCRVYALPSLCYSILPICRTPEKTNHQYFAKKAANENQLKRSKFSTKSSKNSGGGGGGGLINRSKALPLTTVAAVPDGALAIPLIGDQLVNGIVDDYQEEFQKNYTDIYNNNTNMFVIEHREIVDIRKDNNEEYVNDDDDAVAAGDDVGNDKNNIEYYIMDWDKQIINDIDGRNNSIDNNYKNYSIANNKALSNDGTSGTKLRRIQRHQRFKDIRCQNCSKSFGKNKRQLRGRRGRRCHDDIKYLNRSRVRCDRTTKRHHSHHSRRRRKRHIINEYSVNKLNRSSYSHIHGNAEQLIADNSAANYNANDDYDDGDGDGDDDDNIPIPIPYTNFAPLKFPPTRDTENLRRICRNECELLENELCQKEYAIAKRHPTIGQKLPLEDCYNLPESGDDGGDCSKLGIAIDVDETEDCYWENGESYRGKIAISAAGNTCLKWARLMKEIADYPELAGQNYCRNPGGVQPSPWCFIDNNTKEKVIELCDIPKCSDKMWLYIIIGFIGLATILSICIITICCRKYKKNNSGISNIQNINLPNVDKNIYGNSRLNSPIEMTSLLTTNQSGGGSGNAAVPVPATAQIGNNMMGQGSGPNLLAISGSGGGGGGGASGGIPLQPSHHSTGRGSGAAAGGSTVLRVPQYTLQDVHFVEELGEGAFGKVYKGELIQHSDGERMYVAVKALKENASAKTQADFKREIDLISDLKHDNIVCILGVVLKEEPLCMLFEYMTQGDLHEFLIANSPNETKHLTQLQFLHISMQICDGMEYLAGHHYVHRDLAARNCLVGDNLTVKISDFGLSRDIYSSDYYRVQSKSLLPVRWMPSESILYGKFTTESDVWSFGVVLWEIYSYGLQPYYGYSNQEVISMVRARQLLPCPELCPSAVYSLMVECWHEQAVRRPSFPEIGHRLKIWYQSQKRTEQAESSSNCPNSRKGSIFSVTNVMNVPPLPPMAINNSNSAATSHRQSISQNSVTSSQSNSHLKQSTNSINSISKSTDNYNNKMDGREYLGGGDGGSVCGDRNRSLDCLKDKEQYQLSHSVTTVGLPLLQSTTSGNQPHLHHHQHQHQHLHHHHHHSHNQNVPTIPFHGNAQSLQHHHHHHHHQAQQQCVDDSERKLSNYPQHKQQSHHSLDREQPNLHRNKKESYLYHSTDIENDLIAAEASGLDDNIDGSDINDLNRSNEKMNQNRTLTGNNLENIEILNQIQRNTNTNQLPLKSIMKSGVCKQPSPISSNSVSQIVANNNNNDRGSSFNQRHKHQSTKMSYGDDSSGLSFVGGISGIGKLSGAISISSILGEDSTRNNIGVPASTNASNKQLNITNQKRL